MAENVAVTVKSTETENKANTSIKNNNKGKFKKQIQLVNKRNPLI